MVNGARLIVTSFSNNLIAAKFVNGTFKDKIILIPSIIITPSDTDYPFTINRCQFPVINAFALTINNAQGQSFEKIGIYLPINVFSHGQLYVAFSRATQQSNVTVQLNTCQKTTTFNCVYSGIFS